VTITILSALAPGLVCLGLGLLGAAALQRATRPAPVLPWRPAPPELRLRESPESIATRLCRDLAAGGVDSVVYVERGRTLRALSTELVVELTDGHDRVQWWALEVSPTQTRMWSSLDQLDRAIAREIREWRSGAEAMERDWRVGGAS
jgi:hypothetical protein